jgi:hypothetical protein
MRLVARILAVLVAMVVYSVLFLLVLLIIGVLFLTDEGETTSDGQFEIHVVPLPDWVGSAWLAGLAGVIWLVGFRLPWWRRERAR